MMHASVSGVVLGGLLMLAVPRAASSQELLLHFPLDGTPAVAGSAAGDSRLYLFDGGPAPTTVPGRIGNALHFSGKAAIAMPFKLDPVTYPQVTITAWVRLDASPYGGTIFSAGNGNVPKLMVNVNRNNITAARGSLIAKSGMPRDEWVFVAGVVDVRAARLENVQGEAAITAEGVNVGNLYPPSSYRNPDDPSLPAMPYVFVGSHGFGQWRASGMAIDDVRVYASALTPGQVAAIREAGGATIAVADSAGAGTCSGGTACATGTYCAVDGSCYPNSQLPVGYLPPADGSAPAGGPAFHQAPLTEESLAHAEEIRDENAAPVITYASEEEALAAEERRQREAAEAELARQQNELEATRRATESASGSETSGDPMDAGTPYPVGEMRFSGVAGAVGQNKRTLDLQDKFMHRIAWFESSDSPCRIAIAGADVASEVQLDVGCPKNIRPFGLFLSDQARSVELTNSVIGAIAVCNNNPRALYNEALRLKGIRVSGERINDDGSTTYVPASDEDSLRNCAQWSIPNLCPVNPTHLATGLIVHSNDSGSTGNNEDIVGLQLVCRQVGIR